MSAFRFMQRGVRTARFAGVAAIALTSAAASAVAGERAEDSTAPARLGRNTPVGDVTFVVFDTETTGFSLAADRIVAINAVKFRDGEVLEEARWLVNPLRHVPHWARRVHDITEDRLNDAPVFPEAYAEFLDFIEGAILLAHNARFDISFLTEETGRHGLTVPENPVIDTLPLFRKWFPDAESYCAVGLALHLQLSHLIDPEPSADATILQRVFEHGRARHARADTFGSLRRAAGRMLRF